MLLEIWKCQLARMFLWFLKKESFHVEQSQDSKGIELMPFPKLDSELGSDEFVFF